MRKNQMKKQRGVTLIALIITILIVVILAGVTINLTVGENGIFSKAKYAKEKQEIVQITEKLELEKADLKLENYESKLTVANYLEWLKNKKVINDTNIKDSGNGISKVIELNNKYLYLIEELDNENISIEYIGKSGEVLPQKEEIEVISITTNSIKIKVNTTNGKDLEYKYYVKNKATNEEYRLENISNSNEYIYNNLIQNNQYSIMVELQNKYIKDTLEKEITTKQIQELKDSDLQFTYSTTAWTAEHVIVAVSKKESIPSQYVLQTSKDNNTWQEKSEQEFKENGSIYARLWDGTNGSNYVVAQVSRIDNTPPTNINLTKDATTSDSITVTASCKDMQSGITKIELSKDGGKTYNVYKMVGGLVNITAGFHGSSETGEKFTRSNIYEENLFVLKHNCEESTGKGGFFYGMINSERLEVGKKYEWELYIKADENVKSLRAGHEQGGIKSNIEVTKEWKKINYEFTANDSTWKAFIFYNNIQKGNNIYIHSFLLRKLDEDYTSADYNYTFDGLEKGTYQIKARFTNHSGLTSESETITVTI